MRPEACPHSAHEVGQTHLWAIFELRSISAAICAFGGLIACVLITPAVRYIAVGALYLNFDTSCASCGQPPEAFSGIACSRM